MSAIRSELSGIINFHKPVGITSAKALYRIRSITKQRKSGHAGTLDPGASGVLVICLGRGTKLVEAVMDMPKVYRTTARLDVTSESHDSDRPLSPVEVARAPSRAELDGVMHSLEGEILQVPPRISAIKVRGQPAYKRNRADEPIELAARAVRVYWLHVHSFDFPRLEFEMCCGRGTYVRSVIRDLGEQLGTGGCLTSLVRTRVGPFAVGEAWTYAAMESASPEAYVFGVDRAGEMMAPWRNSVPPRPPSPHGSKRL